MKPLRSPLPSGLLQNTIIWRRGTAGWGCCQDLCIGHLTCYLRDLQSTLQMSAGGPGINCWPWSPQSWKGVSTFIKFIKVWPQRSWDTELQLYTSTFQLKSNSQHLPLVFCNFGAEHPNSIVKKRITEKKSLIYKRNAASSIFSQTSVSTSPGPEHSLGLFWDKHNSLIRAFSESNDTRKVKAWTNEKVF